MKANDVKYPLPPNYVHVLARQHANTMVNSVDPSEYVERWDKGKIGYFWIFAYIGHESKRHEISIASRIGACYSPTTG